MSISYKTEASIANNDFVIKTSFVLVKEIHHSVILGTSFINLITPYEVNYDNISFKTKGKNLIFSFIEKPKIRNLNLIKACFIYANEVNVLIKGKQKHL